MEWDRGMELWNGMDWVFGMENGMKILSYTFGVRVKLRFLGMKGVNNMIIHVPTFEWCKLSLQVQTDNMKL